jgi:hypothetical protein
MNFRTFAVFAMLTTPALFPVTAQAWWDGPGNAHNAYYGAGPMHGDVDGGFNFGASFSGRGYGSGAHRYGGYNGYNAYPRPRAAAPSWILRGVNFKYDSAELLPASMSILDKVAATLRDRPTQKLEVGGHASAEGTAQYNLELSNRRAQTVRAYLVKRGINPSSLTYRGYGETRPLTENVTETGRLWNRRVELTPVYHAQR